MAEHVFVEYREQVGTCARCGNSPVNHFQTYVAYTMSVWGAGSKRLWNPLHMVRALAGLLADQLEPLTYRAIAALPFARFGDDPGKALTYRSQVVWEEARRRGIEMRQLMLGKSLTDIYRARVAGRTIFFQSLPTSLFQKANGGWIDDKFLLKQVLREADIPSPRSISVRTLDEAQRAFEAIGAPVVVKPRLGSRARHTSVNVRTAEELEKAFMSAKLLCRYVSIEEHLDGPVCRATLVGGKLAGFFEAYPPRVVGDGQSTLAELVDAQNASKPERVGDIALTSEHGEYLERAGYTLQTVLPEGKTLALTHRTGRLFGGITRELFGKEHPALRAQLERAAALIGAPIVGFDLIIADAEQDPEAQRWGIIEANSLPYIDLHYLPLHGEPTNVARSVWDWVEQNL